MSRYWMVKPGPRVEGGKELLLPHLLSSLHVFPALAHPSLSQESESQRGLLWISPKLGSSLLELCELRGTYKHVETTGGSPNLVL